MKIKLLIALLIISMLLSGCANSNTDSSLMDSIQDKSLEDTEEEPGVIAQAIALVLLVIFGIGMTMYMEE